MELYMDTNKNYLLNQCYIGILILFSDPSYLSINYVAIVTGAAVKTKHALTRPGLKEGTLICN